jgi:hypothetical protein
MTKEKSRWEEIKENGEKKSCNTPGILKAVEDDKWCW